MESFTILGGSGAGVAWWRVAVVVMDAALSTDAARPEVSRARGIDVVARREPNIVIPKAPRWSVEGVLGLHQRALHTLPCSSGQSGKRYWHHIT